MYLTKSSYCANIVLNCVQLVIRLIWIYVRMYALFVAGKVGNVHILRHQNMHARFSDGYLTGVKHNMSICIYRGGCLIT